MDEQAELEHVARPEIDLPELVPLAAIEHKRPAPLGGRDIQWTGGGLIREITFALKGMLLYATGDIEGGMAMVERAMRIHERDNDHEGRGVALSFLAQMTFAKGDHARALALYHDALASLEAVGDHPEIARVYCEMGWTALADADTQAAQHAFVRAVREYEIVGSARGTGLALMGLAAVEAAVGHPERAVAIAAAADALCRRAPAWWWSIRWTRALSVE